MHTERTELTLEPLPPPPPEPVAIDPYAAPTAPVETAPELDASRFYVVSSTKYWILSIATFGLYGFYWVYRQWADIKRATRGDEWPVARAIFSVFFMHALVREIEQVLVRARIRYDWAPEGLATMCVVAMIGGRLIDRVPEEALGDAGLLLSLAAMGVVAFLKWRMQLAANVACGDPDGRGNARFTAGNVVWIVFGALFWLLVLVGLALPAE
jgi:hypothetical protein